MKSENKIDVINISEESTAPKRINMDDFSADEILSMGWQKYLEVANYNKDPQKMCEECIAEQKRKYNGRTPIVCNGLKDYKTSLSVQYDADVIEAIEGELSEEELLQVQGAFSAPEWFRANIKDARTYSPRFYQDLVLKCSAKHKVIRWGRRCGKSFGVVLDIVHRIETADKPLNFLIAAPMKTMIDEIERAVVTIINAVGRGHYILSKKSSPTLEIRFFNGCTIQGITLSDAGTSARGKRADLLWVDEMDFAPRKALEALQAIEMDNPNVEVIYTSTPIGQGNLYNAENLENTKAFHFPSFVIPHYNDALDASMKSSLSDIGYLQECLHGDTLVNTTKGNKKVKDIVVGDHVYYTPGVSVPVIQSARVTGEKPVYEYKTWVGSVTCTDDHSFPDRDGSKAPIKELSHIPYWGGGKKVSEKAPDTREIVLARVLGYGLRGFRHKREDILIPLKKDLEFLFPEETFSIKKVFPKRGKDSSIHLIEAPESVLETFETYQANFGLEGDRELSTTSYVASKGVESKLSYISGLLSALSFNYVSKDVLETRITLAPYTDPEVVLGSWVSLFKSVKVEALYREKRDLGHAKEYLFRIKGARKLLNKITLPYEPIYAPIIEVEDKGISTVYNIGVGSEDHTYLLANGMKTFNCVGMYGLDELGVFQIHYIEECIEKHIPNVMNEDYVLSYRDRFITFIGVDWNHDLNGTRIVVVCYDKNSDRFFIVEKAKIAKQNLTQAIAVDLVVELNRKYKSDHIICDEGFGIGQVTELRTRGREQYGKVPLGHPDLKLVDTMSVQFGSSLEITDPTTQQQIKKNTKQYIVENAQKILEERRLAFNEVDDNELIMQMKNYGVAKTGTRGNTYKPKDKKIGDHDLDAFMLGLYAFDYFYGDHIKPRPVEYGNVVGGGSTFTEQDRTTGYASIIGRGHAPRLRNGRKQFKTRSSWR